MYNYTEINGKKTVKTAQNKAPNVAGMSATNREMLQPEFINSKGELVDQPYDDKDHIYIVSSMVLEAMKGRVGFFIAPDTGLTAVRNEEKRVMYVVNWIAN